MGLQGCTPPSYMVVKVEEGSMDMLPLDHLWATATWQMKVASLDSQKQYVKKVAHHVTCQQAAIVSDKPVGRAKHSPSIRL